MEDSTEPTRDDYSLIKMNNKFSVGKARYYRPLVEHKVCEFCAYVKMVVLAQRRRGGMGHITEVSLKKTTENPRWYCLIAPDLSHEYFGRT